MIIKKNKNVMSTGAEKFIKYYDAKYPTHKIFIEFPVSDFIKLKSKYSNLEISSLLKSRSSRLTFDFYDYTLDIVFETNGMQHYKYNSFFHKDVGSFDRQKANDFIKQTVCDFFNTEIRFLDLTKDITI